MHTLDYIKAGERQTFKTDCYRNYFTTYWGLMADRSVTWMKRPKKIPKLT